MKSISALCCGHRSNLVACVKRKHASSRVLRCSQICQSERQVLTFIFVKGKSLSSKHAALKHRTAFHLDFSGKTHHQQRLSIENGQVQPVCKRLFVSQYTRIKKYLLSYTYRVKIPCWWWMCSSFDKFWLDSCDSSMFPADGSRSQVQFSE